MAAMNWFDALAALGAFAAVLLPLLLARWLVGRSAPPAESDPGTAPTIRHGDADP